MSNANEPAYPQIGTDTGYDRDFNLYPDISSTGGLTKREYFAAMAMQGILSGDHPICREIDCLGKVAAAAVEQADALLAELEK